MKCVANYPRGKSNAVYYPDACEIEWPETPDFLPDWQGNLLPAIGHLTLLDLSLPGTHDSLTYDLSLTTSCGGIDGAQTLAEILHNYTGIVPDGIEVGPFLCLTLHFSRDNVAPSGFHTPTGADPCAERYGPARQRRALHRCNAAISFVRNRRNFRPSHLRPTVSHNVRIRRRITGLVRKI